MRIQWAGCFLRFRLDQNPIAEEPPSSAAPQTSPAPRTQRPESKRRKPTDGRTDESDVEATEVPEVGGVKVIGRSRSRKQQKQQPLVNRWEHPIGFYGLAMAWPYLMGLMRR